MTVDSGTRWLPEALKPSAQSRGECASLGTNAGHQLQSFGRRRNGVLAPIKSRVAGHIKLLRNCEKFSLPRKFYLRPRPAGWTPVRERLAQRRRAGEGSQLSVAALPYANQVTICSAMRNSSGDLLPITLDDVDRPGELSVV
jgi:hypothetical protein